MKRAKNLSAVAAARAIRRTLELKDNKIKELRGIIYHFLTTDNMLVEPSVLDRARKEVAQLNPEDLACTTRVNDG